jgi:AraC-like DNA-binding protein
MQPTVSTQALAPVFIRLARQYDIPMEDIFRGAGLDPYKVAQADSYISQDDVLALFGSVHRLSGDPAFGLHVGEHLSYEELDIVGSLIATSQNGREAIARFNEYKSLWLPFIDITILEENSEMGRILLSTQEVDTTRAIYFVEGMFAGLLTLAEWLMSKPLTVIEVRFRHPQPDYVEEYAKVFDAPILFNQDRDEILIEPELLDMPLAGHFPVFHDNLIEMANSKLRQMPHHNILVNKVEKFLDDNLGVYPASMEDAASKFNMSSRTLQRKLKKQDTSFAVLRDRVRQRKAICFIQEGELEMDQIADRLGFAETSSFYHAFKRWLGCSPGEYRKSLHSIVDTTL